MKEDYPWMIYGATGRAGELIARRAVARGLRPILAGRNAKAIQKLAEEINLSWKSFDVEDQDRFRRELSNVNLLVNAAGPLMQSSVLVAESCLAAFTHCFDLTNQVPSLVAIYTLDSEAREKDLTLLPGLALSPTASNCLVGHLHKLMPEADSVDIAIEPFLKNYIPGANLTVAENLVHGSFRRRAGALEHLRPRGEFVEMVLPAGPRKLIPGALGDVEAVYRSTKLTNVSGYIVADSPVTFGGFRRQREPVSVHEEGEAGGVSGGNDAQSLVWARISKAGHASLEGWIQCGEGHEFTADVVIAGVLELVKKKQLSTGAHAPATVLGPDFILGFPSVKRTVSPLERWQ